MVRPSQNLRHDRREVGIDMFHSGFFEQAKQRATALGVRNVLVASLRGGTVRQAKETFGSAYRFFAVSNPANAHSEGLVYHDGMDQQTADALRSEGIEVILKDQGLFQALSIGGPPQDVGASLPDQTWRGAHKTPFDWRALADLGRMAQACQSGPLNPLWLMAHAIGSLLGDGPAVCIEIVLMAADSGQLPLDEDCMAISCPRPASRAPDAALVVHPSTTKRLLAGLRIKDLLLIPRPDDHWFCDKPLWPEG